MFVIHFSGKKSECAAFVDDLCCSSQFVLALLKFSGGSSRKKKKKWSGGLLLHFPPSPSVPWWIQMTSCTEVKVLGGNKLVWSGITVVLKEIYFKALELVRDELEPKWKQDILLWWFLPGRSWRLVMVDNSSKVRSDLSPPPPPPPRLISLLWCFMFVGIVNVHYFFFSGVSIREFLLFRIPAPNPVDSIIQMSFCSA